MLDFLPYPRRGGSAQPYPVAIPRIYRLPVAIMVVLSLVSHGVYTVMILTGEEQGLQWFGVFFIASMVATFLYMMPVLLGRWPAWAVRLMGREHLDYTVRKFVEGIGRTRARDTNGRVGRKWPPRLRVTIGSLLATCFVAGLASAFSLQLMR